MSLELEACSDIQDAATRLAQLTRLSIKDNTQAGMPVVPPVIAALTSLLELELDGYCCCIDPKQCFGVISSCTQLVKLSLRHCLDMDGQQLPAALSLLMVCCTSSQWSCWSSPHVRMWLYVASECTANHGFAFGFDHQRLLPSSF